MLNFRFLGTVSFHTNFLGLSFSDYPRWKSKLPSDKTQRQRNAHAKFYILVFIPEKSL